MWPQLVRLDGPASPFIANVTNPLDKHATLAHRAACLISIGVGVGGKPGELNLEPACLVARVSDRIAGRIAEAPDKPWFRQRLCDVLRHPGVSRREYAECVAQFRYFTFTLAPPEAKRAN